MLEVPDVEDWYGKLDVRVVSNAIHRIQATRFAECILFCGTLDKAEYVDANAR